MAHSALYRRLIGSREWRRLRIEIIREHPLCQWCEAEGLVVAACECHHIVEVESGRTETEVRNLMFSRTNIVALCHQCHAAYHKAQRYHSSDVVRQRQSERLDAWADSLQKRFNNINNERRLETD